MTCNKKLNLSGFKWRVFVIKENVSTNFTDAHEDFAYRGKLNKM